MLLIYFTTFASSLSSSLVDLTSLTEDDFFGKSSTYVFLLGLVLVPLILKKELNELRVMSMTLFLAITLFVLLMTAQLIYERVHKFNVDFPEGTDFQFFYRDYYKAKFNSIDFLKGVNIIFVGFSCQCNLFPTYAELRNRTN
eukprot:CAMPEP_0170495636 /NCGR_PEP_ID=MMETSP0208-20121228/17752_1 /TAXON_ID=197538 /ORGANISM="Strombidium inclinatum, Strain S3" /LENGTH=141 /DNA_ID=CAMNT_0010771937 /DNA_START=241 /DNA_END=666 /DNA_ORIENTATION=+